MTPAGAAATIAAITADLRRKILAGEYQAGDRLPTRAELAAMHHVSPESAGIAHRRLRDEGLVALRQGSGAFVLAVGAYQVTVRAPGARVTQVRGGRRARADAAVSRLAVTQEGGDRVWRMVVVAVDAGAAAAIGLAAVRRGAGGGDWRGASVEAAPFHSV